MQSKNVAYAILSVGATVATFPVVTLSADYHHVQILAPSPIEAVGWYSEHLDCDPIADRGDVVRCADIEIVFVAQPTLGGTQGTGVNHIAFSFPDLSAKMEQLEAVGVRGSGVRLQRFEDGALYRDLAGLYRQGFIFDPWGTRIELIEDPDHLGFHHVHLSSVDPDATLAWYQNVFEGELTRLKGQIDGLLFDGVWLLVAQHESGLPAPTEGRTLDHLGFVVPDLAEASAEWDSQGVVVQDDSAPSRSDAQRGYLAGPDGVRLAVVEPGWVGVMIEQGEALAMQTLEPYTAPLTPWGEPDLQGVWSGDAAHSIPLERPIAEEAETLTPEEADARRERGTLNSIWGYEREWRDTTLGYAKSAPSRQVALVIDPPDGRLPPMTPKGEAFAAAERVDRGLPAGPEDLSTWVRCITRGLPRLMRAGVYNNGLQIVQGPGYVAVQKEMIHETRVIPTDGNRPHLGADLKQWLGDPRGHWDGDTLVVEVTNFNGKAPYLGAGEDMTLVERYTRIGPDTLEYQFTVDDPTIWVSPWTARFNFQKDDDQYELVEYACHEGNYGLTNILSGARATEQAADGNSNQ